VADNLGQRQVIREFVIPIEPSQPANRRVSSMRFSRCKQSLRPVTHHRQGRFAFLFQHEQVITIEFVGENHAAIPCHSLHPAQIWKPDAGCV